MNVCVGAPFLMQNCASHRMKEKQRRPLTLKEQKLIKGIVAGKPKRQAALEAGYGRSINAAAVSATHVLKKANVQEALQEALDKHGISLDSVIGVVADGMRAEKVVVVGKDEDAFADVQPDHSTRLKAAGMAANFMGLNRNVGEVNINFIGHAQAQKVDYDL